VGRIVQMNSLFIALMLTGMFALAIVRINSLW
jgi:hypothetical protein